MPIIGLDRMPGSGLARGTLFDKELNVTEIDVPDLTVRSSLILEKSGENSYSITWTSPTTTDRILTIPDVDQADTFVFVTEAATLANKTLTSPTINTPTISAGTITGITDLDMAVGNRTIFDTIAGNTLTVGASNTTVSIPGNLTVSGTTTTVNTTTLDVADNIFLLNSDFTGSATQDSGLVIERGDDTNVALVWDESADEFIMVTTNSTGSGNDITVAAYANLQIANLAVAQIDAFTLSGKLTAGSTEIEGSAFDIDGGDVSAINVSGGLTWNAAQNLNSQALTNVNIDSGDISAATISGGLTWSSAQNLNSQALTNVNIDSGDIESATISGGLTWNSAQNLNSQALTNVNIDSGDISAATISGDLTWSSNQDMGTIDLRTGGKLVIDVDSGATIDTSGGGINGAGSITLGAGQDAGLYVKSDDLYIENKTSDKDIIFRGNDGGTFKTLMTIDASEATILIPSATLTTAIINAGSITGLTALQIANNVDVGNYTIRANNFLADSHTSGRIFFSGTDGVLTTDSDLTFATDTLTATKIGAFEAAGAINFSDEAMTNVNIDSGDMTGVTISGALTWNANQDLNNVNLTNVDIDSGDIASGVTINKSPTITLTGDVTASATAMSNLGNVSISTTIAADSVALGTDTTGNYVATITGGTGITSSAGTSGEGTTHSLSVDASQTQITAVGALDAGSITSGFTSIDVGSGAISTTGTATTGALVIGGDISTAAAQDWDLVDNNASALSFDAAGKSGILEIVTTNGSEKVAMSGDLTVAGNMTVTGTTTQVNTVTMNAQNAVIFEGATADNNETTLTIVDPTADHTIYMPNQTGYLPVLAAASTTQVTATPEEINLIDGGTARGTTAIADGDGVLINDAGTMRMTTVETLAAYLDDEITAMPNLTTTAATTVGALASGSIASGFGTISTGNTITTTALISGGSLDIDDVLINGSTIGHTDDTDLITVANGLVTVAGEISVTTLDIGGTNVTATAAELNIIDGDTSASSTTVVDADRVVLNDNGTMKQVAVTDLSTYFGANATTANVTVSANNSNNETVYPTFVDGATGGQGIETDTGLTYNPSSGILTTTQLTGNVVGNVTGNLTGTADVATVATTVTITDNESTNEDNAIIFTAGGDVDGGNLGLESDGTLTYNPSTGKVTATGFIGALTGNVTGDVTGNADTATALATGRTIGMTGDVVWTSPSFTGSGNVTAASTIQSGAVESGMLNANVISGQTEITSGLADADEILYSDGGVIKRVGMDTLKTYFSAVAGNTSLTTLGTITTGTWQGTTVAVDQGGTGATTLNNLITLGTHTTGNYVATVSGTSNEIEVSGSGSETAGVTIGLPDDVTIGGDLTVTGDLTVSGDNTIVNTATLSVEDILVELSKGQTTGTNTDAVDVGIYAPYRVSGGTRYRGMFYDVSTTRWKFFNRTGNSDEVPGTNNIVNTTSGIALGDLEVGTLYGSLGTAAQTAITSVGTLSSLVIADGGNIGSASDTDAIAISSGGVVTMNQIPVFSAGIGALASGTIASGFGTISTGNTITTTAKITGGELDIDDVIINGATIGHTDDTDLITLADGNVTIAGELDLTTLDVSGNADIDGTLEADAITVDGTALNEYIADTVGAMVGSNTESGITVAYQDGDNTLDFTVGTLNQDTTGTADNITVSANNSADETVYPIFVDGATGSQGAESDTGLTYNPSSGLLTSTLFAGTLNTAAQGNITSLGTLTSLTGGTGDLIWDTDTLVVDSSADRVGINAGTSPSQPLHVVGNTRIDGNLYATESDGSETVQISHDGSLGIIQTTYFSGSHTPLTLKTSGSERMRIAADGTVGIGTTTPNLALTVESLGGGAGVQDSLQIQAQRSGTVAAGFGTGMVFGAENAAGSSSIIELARINTLYTDATSGAEDSRIDIYSRVNGSATKMLSINDKVGIGTDNPDTTLHVQASSAGSVTAANSHLTVESSGNTGVTLLSGNTSNGAIFFGDDGDADIGRIYYDHGTGTGGAANRFVFFTNGGERMALDSSGNLILGHKTPMQPAGATPVYNQVGTNQNTSSFAITRFSADTGGPQIFLTKSRHGTIGTYKFPEDGDSAGSIHWQSGDDTNDDLAIEAAVIKVVHTANTTNIGGSARKSTTDMIFSVASDGAAAEKMRINSNSQVEFADGTASLPSITNSGDVNTGLYFPAADEVAVAIGGANKLHIGDNSGRTLQWSGHDDGFNSHNYDPGSGYTGFAVMGLDDYGAGFFVRQYNANAGGPTIYLRTGRAATNTDASNGQTLGSIYFQSGAWSNYTGAYITGTATGTWTTSDRQSKLTLSADTASDGTGGLIVLSTSATQLSSSAGSAGGQVNHELRFMEGSNYVGFKAPALSADQIWTLPTADGSADEVLTTNGSGTLSWAAGGGSAFSVFTQYRLKATVTGSSVPSPISNWELSNTANQEGIGDGSSSTRVEESSGIFTFPYTGYWWVIFRGGYEAVSDGTCQVGMKVSTDNGDNYTHISNAAYGNQDSGATGGEATMDSILKVENITGDNTVKVKFDPSSFASGSSLLGWEDGNNTCVVFIKVGDV